jgi:hypothetical protein
MSNPLMNADIMPPAAAVVKVFGDFAAMTGLANS